MIHIIFSSLVLVCLIGASCDSKPTERPWKWCIVDIEHDKCNYRDELKDRTIKEIDGYWALTEKERLMIESKLIDLEEKAKKEPK